MNVVFDFDKTLTLKDTTRHLFGHLAKENRQSQYAYLLFYLFYKMRILNEYEFKTALVKYYLRGRLVSEVAASASTFVDSLKSEGMNEVIFDALHQHLANGDKVFLASASFDFIIKAFCDANIIKRYFATELEILDGRYTGDIKGPIIKGSVKLSTLESYFGVDGLDKIMFYGDSEDRVVLDRIQNHVEV